MELRFDAILYSKLGNKNSDAGHIKRSGGPQVPHPCSKFQYVSIRPCQAICYNQLIIYDSQATENEPLSSELCSWATELG